MRKTEVNNRNGQRVEGKLLKIVKTKTGESFADIEIQHTEGVLEENQVINGQLKCLLEAFEQEEEVVVNTGEVSHVVRETREYTSSQFYDVFAIITRGVIEYITAIKKTKR